MVEVGDGAAFGHEILREGLLVEGDGAGDGADAEQERKEGGEGTHGGMINTPIAGIGCEEFSAKPRIEG
jgi:hypothetical protein